HVREAHTVGVVGKDLVAAIRGEDLAEFVLPDIPPDDLDEVRRNFTRAGAHVPFHQPPADQLVADPILPFQEIFGPDGFGPSLGDTWVLRQVGTHRRLLSLPLLPPSSVPPRLGKSSGSYG